MSGNPKESKNCKYLQEKPGKTKTNIRAKRKRNQSKRQDSADTTPVVQHPLPLPLTSDEIPGPSKAMKMTSLSQQQRTGKEEKPPFFNNKKDIARTKHGVLSNYLAAWFAILSNNKFRFYRPFSDTNPQYSRLVYVDGFAGPGRYEDDDSGSPLIAYLLALKHDRLPVNGPEIDMIFIEKDQQHSRHLFENLKRVTFENPDAKNILKVKFMVIHAKFAPAMHWILSDNFIFTEDFVRMHNVHLESSQPSSSQSRRFVTEHTPLFVFVDPFGYNGERIPMTLMQKIIQTTNKAEILINLMTGFLQRFMKLDSNARAINLLVGQEECDATWKPIVLDDINAKGIEKMNKFLDHYSDKISEQAANETHIAVFEMRNKRNVLLYNLFSVCQHKMAFFKMKEAMRKCSQSDLDFKYSSFKAKDPNLTRDTLQIENLVQDIVQHFNGGEFQGRAILGSDITEFINEDAVLYQRYKRELTKSLVIFRINKRKGVRQKFDEMTFKFCLSENVNPTKLD